MSREAIIETTLRAIERLPEQKAIEISDFAEFILHKYEDQQLLKGIYKLNAESQSFQFLADEEDLYTEADLKIRYDA